jgi:dihydrofolate reductase
MATVIAGMSMSLDGFIAGPKDEVEHLFGWCGSGDVEVQTRRDDMTFRTDEQSAELLRDVLSSVGAHLCGRRQYDVAGAWGGSHPLGVPVFVVTHNPPADWPRGNTPFTFVTEGVEAAVAQAKAAAGEKIVAISGADVAQQCLNAGLLDGIAVDLVPVLLGRGIRWFDNIANAPVTLDDPELTGGRGVTHLYYRVRPQA